MAAPGTCDEREGCDHGIGDNAWRGRREDEARLKRPPDRGADKASRRSGERRQEPLIQSPTIQVAPITITAMPN